MLIPDMKKVLFRIYIRYLLEEVTVSPKKDFELDVYGEKIRLVVGEEKKLPRFIAETLQEFGIVTIVEELDRRTVIGKIAQLISSMSSEPRIANVPQNFICRIIDILLGLDGEERRRLASEIRKIFEGRAQRIIYRVRTGRYENLDMYEQEYLRLLMNIYKSYVESLGDEAIRVIESIRREIFESGGINRDASGAQEV